MLRRLLSHLLFFLELPIIMAAALMHDCPRERAGYRCKRDGSCCRRGR